MEEEENRSSPNPFKSAKLGYVGGLVRWVIGRKREMLENWGGGGSGMMMVCRVLRYHQQAGCQG